MTNSKDSLKIPLNRTEQEVYKWLFLKDYPESFRKQ